MFDRWSGKPWGFPMLRGGIIFTPHSTSGRNPVGDLRRKPLGLNLKKKKRRMQRSRTIVFRPSHTIPIKLGVGLARTSVTCLTQLFHRRRAEICSTTAPMRSENFGEPLTCESVETVVGPLSLRRWALWLCGRCGGSKGRTELKG